MSQGQRQALDRLDVRMNQTGTCSVEVGSRVSGEPSWVRFISLHVLRFVDFKNPLGIAEFLGLLK